MLIILYLLLVIALPLALSAVVSYRTLPEGSDCPLCGEDSLPLRSRWLRWASVIARDSHLQRRWCLGCGWEGVCRVPPPPSIPARNVLPPGPSTASGPEPTERTRRERKQKKKTAPDGAQARARYSAGKAIDLRTLEVNGNRWRVLLQCWCDADGWHGRLLFGAPSGQLWEDRNEMFDGPSPLDVLGQALSLSDRVLASRLREVISNA